MNGQFERSGVPVSWSLTNQTLLFPSWHVLQELNQEALIVHSPIVAGSSIIYSGGGVKLVQLGKKAKNKGINLIFFRNL
jgi:hypothetical protein